MFILRALFRSPAYILGECGRWDETGPAQGQSPQHNEERESLHIEEQRRRASPLGELALTLLGHFLSLFTILAANGEGQCP